MVERHPYTVHTGVRFSNEVPRADSLMVKQATHNRLSVGSIPSQPTNATLADVVIAAVWRTVERGSIPLGCTKFYAPMVELVDTLVLETSISEFESRYPHQVSGVSIMDNTVGFYPSNGSSILSRRTIFLVCQ